MGGTSDASTLAKVFAAQGVDAVFSYAGRTHTPAIQPLETRIGGFGGVSGLVDYLAKEHITHVVDATHPFAAGMSRNAIAACARADIPLLSLERPPWPVQDEWLQVPDIEGAVEALPIAKARVFLAIGRENIGDFASRPEHFYLLRMVDRPTEPVALPEYEVVIGRGPFTDAGDTVLMQAHGITHLVAKNAGGDSARAKLMAAEALGVQVIMITRPAVPERQVTADISAVLAWLDHSANLGV